MLVAVIVVAGFLIHLPYVIISPGSATPLDSSVVQIDGAQTYPHARERPASSPCGCRRATRTCGASSTSWLDPDRDVEKRSDVGRVPHRRPEPGVQHRADGPVAERRQVRRAHPARLHGARRTRRRSASSRCASGAPAYGVLETGDQVLAVDGSAVSRRVADRRRWCRRTSRATSVSVTFDRNGSTHTASIVAGKVHTEGPGERSAVLRPGERVDDRHRVPRRVVAGVRHLSIPDQRQDQHASASAGRRPASRSRWRSSTTSHRASSPAASGWR